jgi:hypothetical protein
MEWFKQQTIQHLLDTQRSSAASRLLVNVSADATIETTLDTLLAEDVLSVAVYRPNTDPKTYVAVVSAYDVTEALFKAFLFSWC